jgi:peptidoglycan-associated lipoprotein
MVAELIAERVITARLTAMNTMNTRTLRFLGFALLAATAACAPRTAKVGPASQPEPTPAVAETPAAPVTRPPATPPPATAANGNATRVEATPVVRPVDDSASATSLDDLNRNSPLKPAFFPLDSSELDDTGRAVVTADADILKRNPSWKITVEGHADERGTAEYNLSLGDRRASAVKTYLVSLGITEDRLQTVSYGKEFPFDPGHDESAWSKNRRAHFVVTAR